MDEEEKKKKKRKGKKKITTGCGQWMLCTTMYRLDGTVERQRDN
jgi:hypothetical protein